MKITTTLSKKSVDFFKSEAAQNDAQYQRMIKRLLDADVDAHARAPASRTTESSRKRSRAG